ncbi:MAG: glycosyltransferase [Alphaproteobacteria bacterium]|nr:glycosyltransferase [Alphaproteobacteria bacterium]
MSPRCGHDRGTVLSRQAKFAAGAAVGAGREAAADTPCRTAAASRHIVAIPSWYKTARGSGGGYFRDQALALQAAGHHVAVLTPDIYTLRDIGRRGAAIRRGATRVADDGVPTWRREMLLLAPRLPYRNAAGMALCGLKLFGVYCRGEGRPELVHAHAALNAGVVALAIKRRYGVPYVLTEHSTAFAQGSMRRWEHRLAGRVVRGAALCIAPSPHLAALLTRLYPGSQWCCLANPLGTAFLETAAAAHPPAAPFVFVTAARMTPEKGHVLLLQAFAERFRGDRSTRLRLVGDGPLRGRLEQMCRETGIAGQVEFTGTLTAEGVRDALATAHAFVLASEVETFGVVVIEALACGRPVVVTASGGPDHLVEAGNGLLVPVGDRAALAAALDEMRRRAADYDAAAIRAASLAAYAPDGFAAGFAALTAAVGRV